MITTLKAIGRSLTAIPGLSNMIDVIVPVIFYDFKFRVRCIEDVCIRQLKQYNYFTIVVVRYLLRATLTLPTDLRFAALKGGETANNVIIEEKHNHGIDNDDDEEDEVARIISWAVDVARLDPSPFSDVDQDDESDDDPDDVDRWL
ncbi:hypothetical protein Tco_0299622 [Tanacetum coccineum]